MNKELREDLKFYLDRLDHYKQLCRVPGIKWFPGYGLIPFEHRDRSSAEWTYEFWLDGMTRYIEKNKNRK